MYDDTVALPSPTTSDDDKEYGDEKKDIEAIEVKSVAVSVFPTIPAVDHALLQATFKRASWYSLILTLIVAILGTPLSFFFLTFQEAYLSVHCSADADVFRQLRVQQELLQVLDCVLRVRLPSFSAAMSRSSEIWLFFEQHLGGLERNLLYRTAPVGIAPGDAPDRQGSRADAHRAEAMSGGAPFLDSSLLLLSCILLDSRYPAIDEN